MLIFLVSFFIGAFTLSVNCAPYNIEEADQLFYQFIIDFNKQYSSNDEKNMRFSLFKKSLERVNKLNIEHGTEVYGITKMSDFTDEEKNKYLNPQDSGCTNDGCDSEEISDNIPIPTHLDWRDNGKVSPVKDQGDCGSCWAFGTVAAMESQVLLADNKKRILSEKQILDCNDSGSDCNGGCANYAFGYIKEKGIMFDKDYPYAPHRDECKYNVTKVAQEMLRCVAPKVDGRLHKLKQALYANGPLSVSVDARSWFDYTKSIIDCPAGKTNHAVLLVGYGQENGNDYFILKNSWGTEFGEKGFIRVTDDDGNPCNILDRDPVYPELI